MVDLQKDISAIWKAFETIPDPEIPVLSVLDLGMIRDVRWDSLTRQVKITLTPTYSGCPAVDAIAMGIRLKLIETGVEAFEIDIKLSPAWTTDWISEEGKAKMKAFGIAPPVQKSSNANIACPNCSSDRTELISLFGSTACKALYRCLACLEPFDYFKCH